MLQKKNVYIYHLKCIFLFFLILAVWMLGQDAVARDVTVSGGLSTGYEWLERTYDDDGVVPAGRNADDKYSRLRIAPIIEIESLSPRDELFFRYSPSLRYDFETSDNDVDQDLAAEFNRFITKDWRILLSDNYRLTDQVESGTPVTDEDPGNSSQILDSEGRRKYWTNDLSLTSEYTYRQDSLFSIGYTYSVYKERDRAVGTASEDYDRHSFLTSVGHRFNLNWQLSVYGEYVRGLYDETLPAGGVGTAIDNDLEEYRTGTTLTSNLIEHQPLSFGYSFFTTKYDAENRNDSEIHNMNLGWRWDVSDDFSVSLSGGPSYAKTEGQDGQWGYNIDGTLLQEIERGSYGFAVSHGFDQQNFTGTDEGGLQEFWQVRGDFNYEPLQYVSFNLYTSCRYEDQDTVVAAPPAPSQIQTFNTKVFSAGTSIGYQFQQWYNLALSYGFTKQDSEQMNDSYDEHRIALTLSFQKDLFHW